MFTHVVLFRFENPSDADEAKRQLLDLEGRVPSLRGIEVGRHGGTDDPRGWDLCLITRFDDHAGYVAYRDDVEHQKVVSWIKARLKEAAVADWAS